MGRLLGRPCPRVEAHVACGSCKAAVASTPAGCRSALSEGTDIWLRCTERKQAMKYHGPPDTACRTRSANRLKDAMNWDF